MSWSELLDLIEIESSAEVAGRVAERAARVLPGLRLTIPNPKTLARVTPDQIRAALARHKWRVSSAADELGIDRSTVYRALDRERARNDEQARRLLDQFKERDYGPRLAGRTVR